jgi:hypothetical protein
MTAHDIETESLPAHVSICQERYRALESRLDQVETRIEQIHQVLRDIRDDIQDIRDNHAQRWNSAQIGTIAVLMTMIGAMAARLWS